MPDPAPPSGEAIAAPEDGRLVPAPELLEVAQTRWDVDRDPVVAWSSDHRRFWLTDPADDGHRVLLAAFEQAPDDPRQVATALADTVASCDFPPTDDHASVPRVAAALRVAGLGHLTPLATPGPDRDRHATPEATTRRSSRGTP